MKHGLWTIAVLALISATGRAAAQPATSVEQVVQLHLDWLQAYRGYRAKVTVNGASKTGTLEVDNITGKRVYMGWREGLPKDVYVKAKRTDTRSVEFAFSKGFDRTDDLPFADTTLPEGLFFAGTADLFQRGADLPTTMARLRMIARALSVLPPSDLGVYGLRMTMERLVTENLAALVDQVFAFDQTSPASAPDQITMWFNGDGRLDAVHLAGVMLPGSRDETVDLKVTLEYESIIPAAAAAAPEAQSAPPVAEPVRAVRVAPPPPAAEKTAETVVEPFLGSRALVILSLIMVGICIGVVIRLKLSQND